MLCFKEIELETLKCGLCGYEFEKGMSVCRGCQGHIQYGPSGTLLLLGVITYLAVFHNIMGYIESNFFRINGTFGLVMLAVSAVLGLIHTKYLFRNRVIIKKRH